MMSRAKSGRYPWKKSDFSWLYRTIEWELLLTSMLNHRVIYRNDIWEIFGIPDNGTGNMEVKSAFEFECTLEIADHMCKQIYGKTLEEKCKED